MGKADDDGAVLSESVPSNQPG